MSARGFAGDCDGSRQKRTISGDDIAREKNEFSRWMSCDGLRDTTRGNREQIGRCADRDAVPPMPSACVTSPPSPSVLVRTQISWRLNKPHLTRLVRVDVEANAMSSGYGKIPSS